MAKRAAKYKRISRDREGRELGVDRQDQDCDALAARLGYEVVSDFSDNDVSASTRSSKPRPDYRRMLSAAKAGEFDVIIAYTTGRLTRRPREHEDLLELAERYGIRFHFVASPEFDLNTAAGRRVARILAANDAGESEDIAERVARQKLQAATSGQWKGGRRPFGYDADGVTVRPEEAAHVRSASIGVLAGRSLRSLAAEWNGKGLVTSTGGPWRQDSLRDVLLRPRNAGLMEHKGEIIGKAEWPAIVAEDTWRAVRVKLSDPSRRTQLSSARRWLGSGLYLCGICEGSVIAFTSASSSRGKAKPQYVCRDSKHVSRTCDDVDGYVTSVVIERLSRPDAVDLLARDSTKDTADLLNQASVLRQRLDDLAALYADPAGDIDARQLAIASKELRARLAIVEQRIAESGRGSVLVGVVGDHDVAAKWDRLTLDRQRAIVDALMRVTLLPSPKGRRAGWRPGEPYFRPETVNIDWKS